MKHHIMTANELRQSFKDFFSGKGHTIVASAPMVVKDDPTLMFTNAGMNQFKDVILGNRAPQARRVADSQKCLRDESTKVYRGLKENDTEKARKAVSMIVGRDTDRLDNSGIIRAAVETVAENTSDGVTAPLMFTALGGAIFGYLYKAANTMDSMIGYKNEKYAEIGYFAAKLDDILNYIPSRITALIMIFSSYMLKFNGKNAYKIWKRDRRKHASPNSAQTESVCAGALEIRLAGDAYYFGELHKKEYIGDDIRPIKNEDIRKANKLMYCTSVIVLILSIIFRAVIFGGVFCGK